MSISSNASTTFSKLRLSRNRTYRIVPAPLFVSSDITFAVQAADICLYCINWGFRPATWGTIETRQEIAAEFGSKLVRLQWAGDGYRDGRVFRTRGIVHVPDPYGAEPLYLYKEGGNAPLDAP